MKLKFLIHKLPPRGFHYGNGIPSIITGFLAGHDLETIYFYRGSWKDQEYKSIDYVKYIYKKL